MMPENLSDEIRILDECGIDNLDSTIDSSLRKLLDETKDFIHRYLKKLDYTLKVTLQILT